MNPPGDKLATTQNPALTTPQNARSRKVGSRGKPAAVVRFGSASVPVYQCESAGRVRFAISYHRDGKRMRQYFGDLAAAKKEAQLVAPRIQSGMQQMTDLKPHDRESYLAARAKLDGTDIPLVVAVDDYLQCRKLLGDIPLRQAVEDFLRRTNGVKLGAKVQQVADELIATKEQDGMSGRYLSQLRSILGLFARDFTGQIIDIKAEEIDDWLRSGTLAPVTRNNRLTILRVLFGFEKQRNYLPASEPTAPERMSKALKLEWPRNVLRHSFISYRIAKVKSADQVALEAGNSAAIIFKHYRELATEADADEWFGILPKPGQWDNTFEWDRRARVVTLPDSDGE